MTAVLHLVLQGREEALGGGVVPVAETHRSRRAAPNLAAHRPGQVAIRSGAICGQGSYNDGMLFWC